VLPALVLITFMMTQLVAHLGVLVEQTGRMYGDPLTVIAVVAVLWISSALHELFHGLAAVRFGGTVSEIGVRWNLLLIFLYCKVDNYLYLRKRWHQVAIAAVGVFANMLFLLPFFGWWLLSDPGRLQDGLAGLLVLGSVFGLVNLVPVSPLDGYKMVGHGLGLPDLAPQSFGFVVRRITGRGDGAKGYPRKARLAYLGYAIFAVTLSIGIATAAVLLCYHLFSDRFGLLAAVVPAVVLVGLSAGGIVYRKPRAAKAPARRAGGRHRLENHVEATHLRKREEHPMTAASTGPAIVLSNVQKSYAGVPALRGVSLTIERGEFFGLLGPNGAGKTTLVEIATGLRQADGGSVSILGRQPWPRNRELSPLLGLQTQSPAFFVRLTAREHLHTVGALYGIGRREAVRALRIVGLTDQADQRIDTLSGGQQQRLAIATAMLHQPELIFLDEPTAALDPQARRALWKVLRDLKSDGTTVVYTTHHLEEAEALCDRVAIIVDGAFVAVETPENLAQAAAGPTRLLVPAGRITLDQARAIPGVDHAERDGESIVLHTEVAGQVLVGVDAIAGLRGVRTKTSTLEDIYLELTGMEQ
jgi:ABC-type multidrug transport system ATPase subunit